MLEGSERRSSIRAACQVNRLIRAGVTRPGQEAEALYMYVVDLSEGGLRVNSHLPFPEEEEVELCFGLEGFPLDGGDPAPSLQAVVRVAWQRSLLGGTWVTGLAFVDPSPQTKELVGSLLKSFSIEGKRMRFRLRENIEVAARVGEESPWVNGLALDLSAGGVRLRIHLELMEGALIDLMIHLGREYPRLHGRARVAWATVISPGRYDAGLTLEDWSEEQAAMISAYIDHVVDATSQTLPAGHHQV